MPEQMRLLRLYQHEVGLWAEWGAELARKPSSTARSFKGVIRGFLAFHRKAEESLAAADFLVDCKQAHVTAYLADCKKRGLAPATVQNRAAILMSLFRWLKLNSYREQIPEIPIQRSTAQVNPTKRIPPESVWPAIEAEINREDNPAQGLELAAWYVCAFFGGLRRSEICGLRIQDVQSIDGTTVLYLRSTKGRESAQVAISDLAATVLWAWVRSLNLEPPSALVFALSESFYYLKFRERFNAAPHAARACAISQMLAAGVGYDRIKSFSRHKSADMLYVYDKRQRQITDSAGLDLAYPKKQ